MTTEHPASPTILPEIANIFGGSSLPPGRARFALSLRGWLVWLVLASIVPLLAFILGSEYLDYRSEVTATGQRTLVVARGMSQLIDEELEARIKILQTLAVSRALKAGDLDTFRAHVETVAAQQFPGANIVLLREDGQQLMNTLVPRGAPLPVRANLESIKQVFATHRPAVSNLFQGAVVPRPVIAIDVPVDGPDGTVAYVLSLNPNLGMFAEIINRQHLPASWLSGIVDSRGILVARVPGGDQFVGHAVAPSVFGHMTAEHQGIAESTSLEGIPTLTVFSHVDSCGWAVAIGVPRTELTGPALGTAMRTLAVGGILLSLSLALAVYVARRSLAKAVPLRGARSRLVEMTGGWVSVAMIVAIGLTVTVIAFMTANRAEEARVVKKLEFRTEWRARDLEAKLVLGRRALWATATYAASRSQLDATRFLQFTSLAAAGSSSITSIAWALPVTGEERAKFEAETGFPIIEDGPNDKRSVAAERDDYTPFVVQNRFDGGPPSLGLDESKEPNRRRAIEMARDTGLPQTVLKPEASTVANPLDITYWPIFDTDVIPTTLADRLAHLRGYVVGGFKVVTLLNNAIADTPDIPETIDFYVSNDTGEAAADSSFQLVATYSPTDRTVHAAHTPVGTEAGAYSFTRSFDQRGQRWRTVSSFSPEAVAAERSIGPLAILFAGLLLTTLLAAYWVAGIRRVSVVRALVDERTAELTQTNVKLEALIDASPNAIICLDAGRRVILWNAAAERLFGYSEAEIIGCPYPLVLPEEEEEFEDRFQRLAAGEVLRNLPSHRRHRLGTAIDTSSSAAAFYDAAGALLGIIFAIEDTRERSRFEDDRRLAEENLRVSDDRFRSIFGAVSEGIFIVSPAGSFTEVNDAGCRMLGYTSDELIGGDIEMISSGMSPYTQAGAMEWHTKAKATGRPQRFDWQCKTKDGRLFGAEVSIQFATISGHEVVLAMLRDITDRQAIEGQLRQAQKMEAVGQLTGGLAHDFNNLLGIVLGNLDLLAEQFEPGGEARELADAAIGAALRGAELTRQLLAFSRRQPLAPKVTYLPPVLDAMGSLLRRTLGEAITFELKVANTLWPVLIDVSQLESTLLNLSVNARDAMPQGGRVTMEAANTVVDESTHQHNLEATPGEYVLIAVSDTGAGMSAEVLAHVFEPFFTTKGSGGTGLGLSMVHGFLKQSGGYTGIYSEPGRGTIIRLYLPRALEGEDVAKIEHLPIETLARGQELILVVEDNKGLRDIAVRQLQDLGYRTIPAGDGNSALEIILGGAPIDLLFTDVVMPGGLDGRALSDAARRQRPQLKVLFTSGFTAAAASAGTEDQFASNLLSKPYRKAELAGRIRAALDTS